MNRKSNTYSIGEKVKVRPERIRLINVRDRDKPSVFNTYTVVRISMDNGTIYYDIENDHNRYSLVEEALESVSNEPDDTNTTTEKEDVPFDYTEEFPLTGNLNITLDALDEDMLKKWHNQIDEHVRRLDDATRKEIRETIIQILKEKGLIT